MMLSPPYLNRTDQIQQDPHSLFCFHHPVTLRICVRFKALVQNSSPYSYSFAFRLKEAVSHDGWYVTQLLNCEVDIVL